MSDAYERGTDDWVEVRPGQVGHGVFAKSYIPCGVILGPVDGTLIDDPDYTSEYIVDMGGGYSLEPAPPFRFLNHSCSPNCELFGWDEEIPPGDLYIAVLRDLEAGEQLTIDYAWEATVAIRCLCDSDRCRGWIVAEEQLPLLLAAIYGPAACSAEDEDCRVEVATPPTDRPEEGV